MTHPAGVRLRRDVGDVDWLAFHEGLAADGADHGRTPEQLAVSFAASAHVVLAVTTVGDVVVGMARALSDGVSHAYVVDVWTATHWRRKGIGTAMVRDLLDRVPGQHVALLTDEPSPFLVRLGFEPERGGMAQVLRPWLRG